MIYCLLTGQKFHYTVYFHDFLQGNYYKDTGRMGITEFFDLYLQRLYFEFLTKYSSNIKLHL